MRVWCVQFGTHALPAPSSDPGFPSAGHMGGSLASFLMLTAPCQRRTVFLQCFLFGWVGSWISGIRYFFCGAPILVRSLGGGSNSYPEAAMCEGPMVIPTERSHATRRQRCSAPTASTAPMDAAGGTEGAGPCPRGRGVRAAVREGAPRPFPGPPDGGADPHHPPHHVHGRGLQRGGPRPPPGAPSPPERKGGATSRRFVFPSPTWQDFGLHFVPHFCPRLLCTGTELLVESRAFHVSIRLSRIAPGVLFFPRPGAPPQKAGLRRN